MSIFNEFFKKEKPVFTGLKFGFGSGGGGAPSGPPEAPPPPPEPKPNLNPVKTGFSFLLNLS